ncbi:gliding motility-associated C-terminal domain-containing protein [Sediminibacterium goheungense]|uniref:Gliding motility-associated-like protein n=1 Tax=Sediminibacterium goheungense TaxID=1086393 RepID=A0A4R6IN47_9BACT|nr:gliding motility-associated C-terminal domain-containing protein [Sediminibacterium goheungense]TDO23630.1 gliding motility-associated-like protein [Sediminibacterium goheungense]
MRQVKWVRIVIFTCYLFSITCSTTIAQCKNDLFNVSYTQTGGRTFSELVALPSNRIILGGSTSSGLNLIKIDTNGDTIFSRFISPIFSTVPGTSSRSELHPNNTLFNIHLGSLIHTDTNANVLAIKQLVTGNSIIDRLDMTKLGMLQNGDLIIVGKTSSGYFLIRSSSDLKTIYWSKHIKMQSTNALTLMIDEDKILVTGYYNDGSFSGLDAPYLASFDASNGRLIRSSGFDRVPGYSTRINQIIKTGNDYVLEIYHLQKNFDPTDLKFILRLDSSFNILSTKRVKTIFVDRNEENSSSNRLLADRDGAYYMNSRPNGSFLPTIVARVGPDDQLKWSSNLISSLIGFGDLKQTSEGIIIAATSVYNNVVLNRTETGISFAKVSFSGYTFNCFSPVKVNTVLVDTTYTKNNLPVNHDIRDSVVSWIDITYVNPNIQTTLARKCTLPGACDSLNLVGNTKVCNSNPVTYTGKRNANCFNRVDWEIIPGNGVTSKILTDSTISLIFFKSGRYLLVSRLVTSCGILYDSIHIDASVNNLNLGNDTTLCPGQTIRLNAGNFFDTYSWQNGSSDSFFIANRPGKYWVAITNGACNLTSTDTIIIAEGKIYQFPTRTQIEICLGQSADLIAESGFKTYQWTPGYYTSNQSRQIITVNPVLDTFYTVVVTDEQGCSGKDTFTIKVKPYPDFSFPADTLLCDNATLLLNVGQPNPGTTYLWQDGSTTSSFTISKAGSYDVTVNMNGCSTKKNGTVRYQLTPSLYLGRDSIKCIEHTITLDVSFPDANYLWQDGKTTPLYQIQNAGLYHCTITNGCGIVKDTLIIQNEICECSIEAPNIFSPNGDGIHDFFNISTKCQPAYYSLFIYNRNGQVIFFSNSHTKLWNGTYQGKPVPIGTYYYLIKVRGVSETVPKQKSGSITLIR